jgi:hypothetical protein
VFEGFAELFENFEAWLGKIAGTRVHGHLYSPDRAEYSGGETVFNGALSDNAALRDYAPKNFLTNLIWNTRGERQCFQFGPRDSQDISWFLAGGSGRAIARTSAGFWRAIPMRRFR